MTTHAPRKVWASAAFLTALLISAAPAAAGEPSVVQVGGRGVADSKDVTGGRTVRSIALDRAFADAVGKQVRREITVAASRRARAKIESEILRRARLYVRSYKITGEHERGTGVELVVVVSIDRDKLLAGLSKLGVARDSRRRPRRPSAGGGSRPLVAIVLHASRGPHPGGSATVDTTFGARGGNGGPAGVALASQLRALGFDLVAATGATASASTNAQADLPVGDSAAVSLARSVGAGAVVVVGVAVSGDGRVRATTLQGAAGRAAVRVLDVGSGKLITSAKLREAGVGASTRAALVTAAAALGRSIGDRIGPQMARRWPTSMAAPTTGLLVVVRGASQWASVVAVIKRVRAIPGMGGVSLRRLREGSVALVADTRLTAVQLASRLGRAALSLGTASASAVGGRVDVVVDGDRGGHD